MTVKQLSVFSGIYGSQTRGMMTDHGFEAFLSKYESIKEYLCFCDTMKYK